MRKQLWIPLAALALGAAAIGGFAATAAVRGDSGGAKGGEAVRMGQRHEAEAAPGERGTEQARPGERALELGRGARLGIAVRDITPELRDELNLTAGKAVVVVQVAPGGPAAEAGVRIRDVILSVDGKPVDTAEALIDAIAERDPGDRVELGIERDSGTVKVSVELGRGLGLGPLEGMMPGQGPFDGLGALDGLRDILPGLDFQGARLDQILGRFVRADVTLLTAEGKPTTLHVMGGTVRSATAQQLVLTPNGGGPDATFAIDGETKLFRGLQRIEAADISEGERAVVLTRDDETRARAVFLVPALGFD